MMLTAQYEAEIAKIDRKIEMLLQHNLSDEELMVSMLGDMPRIKVVMDHFSHAQLNELCKKYGNFFYYAKLLERIAQLIANGEIKVV